MRYLLSHTTDQQGHSRCPPLRHRHFSRWPLSPWNVRQWKWRCYSQEDGRNSFWKPQFHFDWWRLAQQSSEDSLARRRPRLVAIKDQCSGPGHWSQPRWISSSDAPSTSEPLPLWPTRVNPHVLFICVPWYQNGLDQRGNVSDIIAIALLFSLIFCTRLFTGYDDHKKEIVAVKPSDHKAQIDAWLVHADAVLSRMWLIYHAEVALFYLLLS